LLRRSAPRSWGGNSGSKPRSAHGRGALCSAAVPRGLRPLLLDAAAQNTPHPRAGESEDRKGPAAEGRSGLVDDGCAAIAVMRVRQKRHGSVPQCSHPDPGFLEESMSGFCGVADMSEKARQSRLRKKTTGQRTDSSSLTSRSSPHWGDEQVLECVFDSDMHHCRSCGAMDRKIVAAVSSRRWSSRPCLPRVADPALSTRVIPATM
jgi:hypothetical protein